MIRYGKRSNGSGSVANKILIKDEGIGLGSAEIINFVGTSVQAQRLSSQEIEVSIGDSSLDYTTHNNELYLFDSRINKYLSVHRDVLFFTDIDFEGGFLNPFTRKYNTFDGGFYVNDLTYITKIDFIGTPVFTDKIIDIRNNSSNTVYSFNPNGGHFNYSGNPIPLPTIPASINVFIHPSPERFKRVTVKVELAHSY